MTADVKASYERIIRPPPGIVSSRQAYYADFGPIATPDKDTVVFKLESPVAGALGLLASPFNCIYSALKLAQNPRYPETEIMGSGAFTFVEHIRGSSWSAKRFEQYFKPGLPYLDGYKAFFVKPPMSCLACSAASSTPSSGSARPPSGTSSSKRWGIRFG
jgi:peptide/nickel transport system substrate-binding protein